MSLPPAEAKDETNQASRSACMNCGTLLKEDDDHRRCVECLIQALQAKQRQRKSCSLPTTGTSSQLTDSGPVAGPPLDNITVCLLGTGVAQNQDCHGSSLTSSAVVSLTSMSTEHQKKRPPSSAVKRPPPTINANPTYSSIKPSAELLPTFIGAEGVSSFVGIGPSYAKLGKELLLKYGLSETISLSKLTGMKADSTTMGATDYAQVPKNFFVLTVEKKAHFLNRLAHHLETRSLLRDQFTSASIPSILPSFIVLHKSLQKAFNKLIRENLRNSMCGIAQNFFRATGASPAKPIHNRKDLALELEPDSPDSKNLHKHVSEGFTASWGTSATNNMVWLSNAAMKACFVEYLPSESRISKVGCFKTLACMVYQQEAAWLRQSAPKTEPVVRKIFYIVSDTHSRLLLRPHHLFNCSPHRRSQEFGVGGIRVGYDLARATLPTQSIAPANLLTNHFPSTYLKMEETPIAGETDVPSIKIEVEESPIVHGNLAPPLPVVPATNSTLVPVNNPFMIDDSTFETWDQERHASTTANVVGEVSASVNMVRPSASGPFQQFSSPLDECTQNAVLKCMMEKMKGDSAFSGNPSEERRAVNSNDVNEVESEVAATGTEIVRNENNYGERGEGEKEGEEEDVLETVDSSAPVAVENVGGDGDGTDISNKSMPKKVEEEDILETADYSSPVVVENVGGDGDGKDISNKSMPKKVALTSVAVEHRKKTKKVISNDAKIGGKRKKKGSLDSSCRHETFIEHISYQREETAGFAHLVDVNCVSCTILVVKTARAGCVRPTPNKPVFVCVICRQMLLCNSCFVTKAREYQARNEPASDAPRTSGRPTRAKKDRNI